MATEYDILVSHNPPAFGRHSSSSGYLTSCGNCRFQNQQQSSNSLSVVKTSAFAAPNRRHDSPSRRHASPMRSASLERKPRRPCLVTRPDDSSSSSSSGDENEPIGPNRQKKKVVFADDRGLSLTQVRMMVESHYDRSQNFNAFRRQLVFGASVTKPAVNNVKIESKSSTGNIENCPKIWKTTFSQPASNYLDFRRKLDEGNISLENVIIKQNSLETELIGTIKVKNICYEKTVLIRSTFDDWFTYEDTKCDFVDNNQSNNPSANITVIYDTFSFKLILPASKSIVQFCVCFQTIDGEFWDNNGAKNYTILKNKEPVAGTTNTSIIKIPQKRRGLGVRSHTWPEFANTDFEHTDFEQRY